MAFLEIKNVRVVGMATAVPKNVAHNSDAKIGGNDVDKFIEQIGVSERRESMLLTAADLQVSAVERMLSDLQWEKDSVDAILSVSISPDYPLPVNACMLQDRLGLSRECYAQDISLGCSGWVYGLSVIATLLRDGNIKRGLLVTGDSKMHWGKGREALLFGHAACVTALEYEPGSEGFKFEFGTDGSNYDAIIMPKSGLRNLHYDNEMIKQFEDPFMQHSMEAEMKSLDVFSFSISRVPESISTLCDHFGVDFQTCDYLVLHQANKSINQHICNKMMVDSEKAPSSLERFGNTLSSSIPVTITTQLKGKVEDKKTNFICCGFGVGLSWASVAFSTEHLVLSDLVEVDDHYYDDLKWV